MSAPTSAVVARFQRGGTVSAARGQGAELSERLSFWASVALVLVFSQCWVMFLTGPGPEAIDPAVSASVRNLFFPAYALVLLLSVARLRETGLAMLRAPALLLLLVVACASITWSIDPEVTTRRCIAVSFTTLAGLVIGERFAWPRFLEVLATALGITVALSFAAALVIPGYGIMPFDFPGAWRGLWSHKNTLGYYMSVSFMVFIASAIANPRRRWLWAAAAVGSLALILLSTSKTSLVSCLLGACCIPPMAMTRRGPGWAVVATYLWVSVILGLVALIIVSPDLLLGLVGKDATLTGRTQIWAAVARQIEQRPLGGFGYGAVWDSTSRWGPLPWISRDQGFVVHEAHNTWLGLQLELGYLGLGAWTLLFVGVWARAILGLYFRPSAYFALPFLAVFSLHTFTESVALMQNDLIWLMFAATAVKLAIPEPLSDRPEHRVAPPGFIGRRLARA